MDFLYIILSMCCRLLPFGTLFRSARRLNWVAAQPGIGGRELQAYALWLPMAGYWTIWTTFVGSQNHRRLEIVRIERGLPGNGSRDGRTTDVQSYDWN